MKALTGKAFKAFKDYIKKEKGWTSEDFTNHYKCQGYDKYPLADIIDWLDSVGIYVETAIWHREKGVMYWGWQIGTFERWIDNSKKSEYNSRQQTTKTAIERAVELFNESSER